MPQQEIDLSTPICFIGLGIMGFPMAGHLARKGYPVTVFNRTPSKSDRWTEQFEGNKIDSLNDIGFAKVVISCIGNDHDLRNVFLGENGVLKHLQAGALVIDHTTASAEVARELHRAAEKLDIEFLDAPVSGGQQGAENGTLTIMCGGKQTTFDKTRPILEAYGQRSALLGKAGAGQLTKMANQIAIAGLLEGLAESLHFAESAGLDRQQVIDVISKGAAQSWQMDNRHKTMIKNEYDHGFAVDLMRKDLAICLQEARSNGARLPVTALVDQFYGDVQQMGGGKWDTSSLLARLRKG